MKPRISIIHFGGRDLTSAIMSDLSRILMRSSPWRSRVQNDPGEDAAEGLLRCSSGY